MGGRLGLADGCGDVGTEDGEGCRGGDGIRLCKRPIRLGFGVSGGGLGLGPNEDAGADGLGAGETIAGAAAGGEFDADGVGDSYLTM